MSTRGQSRPTLLTAMVIIAILLTALGQRLDRIDAQSLWNDEGTSLAIAQRDLATITRDAAGDIHPPLYYWLLAAWQRVAGRSEFSVRSLSALLGVALVALIYSLARLLQPSGARLPYAAFAAAALATINPFLVVYAQEARMYTLLAVWAALAFYAALRWLAPRPGDRSAAWALAYLFAATAGLYTHYAFPLVLVPLNLVVLLAFVLRQGTDRSAARRLAVWLALQAGALLLFVPWLPVAYRQLTTWPGVDQPVQLLAALDRISQILATGPAAAPWPVVNWLLLLLLLVPFPRRAARLGAAVAWRSPVAWLVVPVALILLLGLYKEAYLKFLIVASPAYCLLAGRLIGGAAVSRRSAERGLAWRASELAAAGTAGLLLIGASLHGLADYYTDPAYARDDYRGMAAYLEAVGRPGDAVVLNAPGQQEVFGYYYDGDLPVYPLPGQRPADAAATEAALQSLVTPGGRVFALLWATDESDPGRLVEGWLDQHAYKALDSWYGNVRLVAYAVPAADQQTPARELNVRLEDLDTGQVVTLLGYSQLEGRVAAGDIAQITLFWQSGEVLQRRYKVFLHLLDEANHIAGQRDSEPGGGSRLTTLWEPGQVVSDNYGLPVHPATPPGTYRLEVGLYDAETGRRLRTPGGEGQVWLEPLQVERPPAPAPVAALGMERVADAGFGPLVLLGYDAHRLGFAHEPDAPLHPGDVLHVNLYWQARAAPGGEWQVSLRLVAPDAQEVASVTGAPAGGYATSLWQPGDVWRGQFDLPLPGSAPSGRYQLQVRPLAPGGGEQEPFLIPLTVRQ